MENQRYIMTRFLLEGFLVMDKKFCTDLQVQGSLIRIWTDDEYETYTEMGLMELLNEQHDVIQKQKKKICDYHMENGMVIDCHREYKKKISSILLEHYHELTNRLEGKIDCPCVAQSRARIIAIMEDLEIDLDD